MNDELILAKLRWQCRRGMLELDLLLQSFLENVYEKLSETEKKSFALLLEQQDQDLYEWLIKREPVPDQTLMPIIERVRNGQ